MNNYIVTEFGFVKDVVFNIETKTHVIEYTNKIRNAKLYNTKGAKKTIENNSIKGFIYNPYEEEPIRDMYTVKKTNKNDYNFDKTDLINEYIVEKAMMIHETDVDFLQYRKSIIIRNNLMNLDEATAKALDLNKKMLNELKAKIKRQK